MIKLVLNFKKKYNNNKYNKLKLNKLLMMMKTLRDKDIKIHFIFLDNETMKVIIFLLNKLLNKLIQIMKKYYLKNN